MQKKYQVIIKNTIKGVTKIQKYEGEAYLVVVEKDRANRYATSIATTDIDQVDRLLSASIFQVIESLLLEGVSQNEITTLITKALQQGIGNAVKSVVERNGGTFKQ